MIERIVNFSDVANRREFFDATRTLKNKWHITLKQWRPTRHDWQNSLYWVAYVSMAAELYRELWGVGKEVDHETMKNDAHEALKKQFLTVRRRNIWTDEVMEFSRSTTTLTEDEFWDYLESIAKFLAEHGYEPPTREEYQAAIDPSNEPLPARAESVEGAAA